MLTLEGVVASYGAVAALRGIDLTVAAGELVRLIGANGAGKSSTLRAISGLLRPTAGRIVFDGRDIHAWEPFAILEAGVAHCPEGRRVFPHLTVQENLVMGAYVRRDQRAVAEDLERMCTHFPILAERRRQMAGTLSGGEQQMLAIARALVTDPRLILLDEPSEGLAPLIVDVIGKAIRAMAGEGVAVLLVEQDLHLALGVSDEVAIMGKGAILYRADTPAFRRDPQAAKRLLGVET